MRIISPVLKGALSLLPNSFSLPILFGQMKGIKWLCNSANPGQVLGRYEPKQTEHLITLLKQSTVFWDIGAHVGWYSLLASKVMSKGQIVCFEPNPSNLSFIHRHLEINDISNVAVAPIALSDKSGSFSFGGDAQYGQLKEDGDITVQTTTADEFLRDSAREAPDLIKLDIEGAEIRFLNGATNIIKQHRPKVMLSAHGHEKRDWCIAFLEKHGYSIETLVSDQHAGDYVFLANPN